MKADVVIFGSLGFYTFDVRSEAARQWVEDNVALPDYNSNPSCFHVDDTRLARDIAEGMMAEGFEVK